ARDSGGRGRDGPRGRLLARTGAGARHGDPAGPAMRFGYADPPYPGQAWRLYGKHPDYAGEVDHTELIAQLERDFPDGWALSTSAMAPQEVLALCPKPTLSTKNKGRYLTGTGVRVLPWCKPLSAWRP